MRMTVADGGAERVALAHVASLLGSVRRVRRAGPRGAKGLGWCPDTTPRLGRKGPRARGGGRVLRTSLLSQAGLRAPPGGSHGWKPAQQPRAHVH